jgi:hypothetical protein
MLPCGHDMQRAPGAPSAAPYGAKPSARMRAPGV